MNFKKPIIFFDLETTGTDTTKDKPVSFAATKEYISEDKPIEKLSFLINPCMPIPPGATAVHGITNEMVQGAKTFKEMANELYAFFRGCDIAGFNILTFDVPMLSDCFAAEGLQFPEDGCNIIDAYKIFAHYERRDLTGAAKFYLNETHDGAHDALADVLMTRKVFLAQIYKYPELNNMSPTEAQALCMDGAVDLAGKIKNNASGVPCYNFGKAKDTPVKEDPGFGFWMLKNSFPENTKAIVRQLLNVKK